VREQRQHEKWKKLTATVKKQMETKKEQETQKQMEMRTEKTTRKPTQDLNRECENDEVFFPLTSSTEPDLIQSLFLPLPCMAKKHFYMRGRQRVVSQEKKGIFHLDCG
jgi:hypothetical protein